MLEPKEYISDDLSLFLKTYLTSKDYKEARKKIAESPSEELIKAVIRQERSLTDYSIPYIENLIAIAAKKRKETNPRFNKVMDHYKEILLLDSLGKHKCCSGCKVKTHKHLKTKYND